MKTTINEYQGCFFIEMTAETIEDAALLVRLGMNSTKELRISSFAGDGRIDAHISIGNRKSPESKIKK